MGWIMGFSGGLLEYLLLKQMLAYAMAGRIRYALVFMMLNFCCMIGVLVLVLLLWRSQLVACGAMMALAMIASAVLAWLKELRTKKEGD